jgi:hypothetical protein
MTRLAFALLLVALASGSAAAQILPSWDIDRVCLRQVDLFCEKNRGCDRDVVMPGCSLQEEIARSNIRDKWDYLSLSIRSYCLRWMGSLHRVPD